MSIKDGGPAFPARIPLVHDDDQGKDYPDYAESGMSLRDWFAGHALIGLTIRNRPGDILMRDAYALADAMLTERAK